MWGVSVSTAILQTQLINRLPADFTVHFPQGVAIAYSVIPAISALPEPLKTEVREAYALSIAKIWQVMIGISAMGLLASLFMKGLPLHSQKDEQWGLKETTKNETVQDQDP